LFVFDGEAVDEGEDFGEVLFVGLGGDEEVVYHVDQLVVGERGVVDDGAVGWEGMSVARPVDGDADGFTHQRKNEQRRPRQRGRNRTDRGSCP